MGAHLQASPRAHRVYGPISHALPVIECAQSAHDSASPLADVLVTSIQPCPDFLCSECLSCGVLWQQGQRPRRSYKIMSGSSVPNPVFDSQAEDLAAGFLGTRTPWNAFFLPTEWQSHSTLLTQNRVAPPQVVICGPNGSGKSTFARCLINSFLTKASTPHGVAFLDLDPGQPEFSCAGQLTLSRIRSCVFGPPFCHPQFASDSGDTVVRSCYLGDHTPKSNTVFYMECLAALAQTYRRLLLPIGCPLIVNTCGWIQGRGLELLRRLTETLQVDDIVYLKPERVDDPADEIQTVVREQCTEFHRVSSPAKPTQRHNAKGLRTLQRLAYLYFDEHAPKDGSWKKAPLQLQKPLELYLQGPRKACFVILTLGHRFDPTFAVSQLEGCFCGLIAIEERPVLQRFERRSSRQRRNVRGTKVVSETRSMPGDRDLADPDRYESSWLAPTRSCLLGEAAQNEAELDHAPALISGPDALGVLHPSKSRFVAQVYIRSVEEAEGKLQLLTPAAGLITLLTSKNVPMGLVRGRIAMPLWTGFNQPHEHPEIGSNDLPYATPRAYRSSSSLQFDDRDDMETDCQGAMAPWVDQIKSGKAAQKGARTWRSRRNLRK